MGGEFGQWREWNHDAQPRLAPARGEAVSRGRAAPGARPQPRSTATSPRCTSSTSSPPASSGSTARRRAQRRRLPAARRRRRARPSLVVCNFTPGAAPRLPRRRAARAARDARSSTPTARATAAATSGNVGGVAASRPLRTAALHRCADPAAARRRAASCAAPDAMTRRARRSRPGRPTRSARPGTAGVNFAALLRARRRASSCACSTPSPAREREAHPHRASAPTRSGTCYLPDGAAPASSTAFACTGPTRPREGHRFNPAKLLLDPYARAHRGGLPWHDALFGYGRRPRRRPALDARDSAPCVPEGVVVDARVRLGQDDRPPRTPWHDTVIYEAARQGLHRAASRRAAGRCAAPTPASPHPPPSRT